MTWTSKHIKWLVDIGKRLKTADSKEIDVWVFRHEKDDEVRSAWARHLRNHYCLDTKTDFLRRSKPPQPDYPNANKMLFYVRLQKNQITL